MARRILLREVWGYGETIQTHTLETHIFRLRQKIENDPAHPVLLITDSQGYRLDASDSAVSLAMSGRPIARIKVHGSA